MKVYSLTGRSGTGKSYHAQVFCHERGIESIIDDGLFIYRDQIVAGVSAKREKTKVGAIRTALFSHENHAEETKTKIVELNPNNILILGTSDRMADIIAERLNLPEITERIRIEDITSEEERREAAHQRHGQGKHIIPASTMQLKRDFAGYFIDPMRLWRKAKNVSLGAFNREPTKTVVRPTYSYLGDFIISDTVITDVATCVGVSIDGIDEVVGVAENTSPDDLILHCTLYVKRDAKVRKTARIFQKKLVEVIEEMTAFNVVQTDVEVRLADDDD